MKDFIFVKSTYIGINYLQENSIKQNRTELKSVSYSINQLNNNTASHRDNQWDINNEHMKDFIFVKSIYIGINYLQENSIKQKQNRAEIS